MGLSNKCPSYCCISSALGIGGSSDMSYISVSLIIACIMFFLIIGDMPFFLKLLDT